MKKTCFTVVISYAVVFFLTITALAGSYDYEGTDSADDVKDTENDTFTSLYPDIDITFAKVEETGDNLTLTLQVKGNIVDDNYDTFYNFVIDSIDSSDYILILFRNYSGAYTKSGDSIIYFDNTTEGNTLTITVPKTTFEDITLPWNVSANAATNVGENRLFDEVILKSPTTSRADNTLLYIIMVIILILLITTILLRRKKRHRR